MSKDCRECIHGIFIAIPKNRQKYRCGWDELPLRGMEIQNFKLAETCEHYKYDPTFN